MTRLSIATILFFAPIAAAEPKKLAYPPSRVENVIDTLHGVKVRDPYRWLEDGNDPAVKEWTAKQNAFTREWLDKLPGRERLRAKLDSYLDIGSLSPAVPRGDKVFYTERIAKQTQPVLYVENNRSERRVVVDPNPLSTDGTVTLDWWFPGPEGRLLAYGLSSAGSEQSTLHVIDVATGKELPDKIERTRACSLAWTPDSKGFYYTRYPKPGSVPKGQEAYNRRVYFHKLGDDPADDQLLFGENRDPADWPQVALSPDGRWLVVNVEKGWAKSEVYFKDMLKNEDFVTLVEGVDAVFRVTPRDDRFYILTNEKAPNYKVMTVEPQAAKRENWKQLVGASDEVMEEIVVGKTFLFVKCRKGNEAHFSYQYLAQLMRGRAGLQPHRMPPGCAVAAIAGEPGTDLLTFSYQSYSSPSTWIKYDFPQFEPTQRAYRSIEAPANFGLQFMEVVETSCRSKDGTKIPLTLIIPKNLKKDGKNPTVLYGYGGFNISLTPTFNPTRYLTICEYGGIMAIANLRGGGEFGETWHEAGMLGKKQNVFDDFIAAAEFLIKEGYTDAEHLGIMGRSNGGLLVGAAVTQRPDLFKAAVCGVPLLDMVRYHKFLIAKLWIPEYGSPDEPTEFKWLHAYSPYHHVKDGTKYPAALFTTAESDTRVDPLHARKMTARMQAATASDQPILLRLEEKAGHGQGKPRAKLLDEEVNVWSFMLSELGVRL